MPRRVRPAAAQRSDFVVKVAARRRESDDVVSLRLTAERAALQRWQPDAHIDVSLPSGRVRQYPLCHDMPNATDLLAGPECAAVYLCGPEPMMAAVSQALPAGSGLHFERYAPAPVRGGQTFDLELARSGRLLHVPADQSALDVVRDALPDVAYSCRQGFCGSCRQRILSGSADHRDRRLTDAERAAGDALICVSRGAAGRRLVLDL